MSPEQDRGPTMLCVLMAVFVSIASSRDLRSENSKATDGVQERDKRNLPFGPRPNPMEIFGIFQEDSRPGSRMSPSLHDDDVPMRSKSNEPPPLEIAKPPMIFEPGPPSHKDTGIRFIELPPRPRNSKDSDELGINGLPALPDRPPGPPGVGAAPGQEAAEEKKVDVNHPDVSCCYGMCFKLIRQTECREYQSDLRAPNPKREICTDGLQFNKKTCSCDFSLSAKCPDSSDASKYFQSSGSFCKKGDYTYTLVLERDCNTFVRHHTQTMMKGYAVNCPKDTPFFNIETCQCEKGGVCGSTWVGVANPAEDITDPPKVVLPTFKRECAKGETYYMRLDCHTYISQEDFKASKDPKKLQLSKTCAITMANPYFDLGVCACNSRSDDSNCYTEPERRHGNSLGANPDLVKSSSDEDFTVGPNKNVTPGPSKEGKKTTASKNARPYVNGVTSVEVNASTTLCTMLVALLGVH